MKVLNKKEWGLKRICSTCTSDLLVEAEDISYEHLDQRYPRYYWICEVCSGQNDEKDNDLPKPVKEKARTKHARVLDGFGSN